MIDNSITRDVLQSGAKKTVGVLCPHKQVILKCRISKIVNEGKDMILKLKTPKGWPFGHKYIYRSIQEVY